MKKILSFFISILFAISSFAQLEVSINNINVVNNSTVQIGQGETHFHLTNTGTETLKLNAAVTALNFAAPAELLTCWGQCLVLNPTVQLPLGLGAIEVGAGLTNSVADIIFEPNDYTGQISITYSVTEENNLIETFTFTLTSSYPYTSVNNLVIEDEISVFPNPANDYIIFSVNDYNNSKVSIFNILGKKVKEVLLYDAKTNVDLSNFKKGTYFYSLIKNNKTVCTKKLLITK